MLKESFVDEKKIVRKYEVFLKVRAFFFFLLNIDY